MGKHSVKQRTKRQTSSGDAKVVLEFSSNIGSSEFVQMSRSMGLGNRKEVFSYMATYMNSTGT